MGFSICRPSCVLAATNEHAVANWSGKDHTQPYGCSAQLSHCQQWSNLFKNPSRGQHIWLTKSIHIYFLCACSVSWVLGSWRIFLNWQSSLIFPDRPFFSHCCSLEGRGLLCLLYIPTLMHSFTGIWAISRISAKSWLKTGDLHKAGLAIFFFLLLLNSKLKSEFSNKIHLWVMMVSTTAVMYWLGYRCRSLYTGDYEQSVKALISCWLWIGSYID